MPKIALSKIETSALLDEVGRRFNHWTFYARKDLKGGESEKFARWKGDREICMGGMAYLAHAIARTIDAEAEETMTEAEIEAEPSDQGTDNSGYL